MIDDPRSAAVELARGRLAAALGAAEIGIHRYGAVLRAAVAGRSAREDDEYYLFLVSRPVPHRLGLTFRALEAITPATVDGYLTGLVGASSRAPGRTYIARADGSVFQPGK